MEKFVFIREITLEQLCKMAKFEADHEYYSPDTSWEFYVKDNKIYEKITTWLEDGEEFDINNYDYD